MPLAVALILVAAATVSLQPGSPRSVGAVELPPTTVRIAVGGMGGQMEADGTATEAGPIDGAPAPTFDDGTIYKPVAVDTTVDDATGLLTTYTVRSGDTLTGIANQFGVSMMTIWWANNLTSKDQLHVGQQLVIPPVDGLIVTVAEGDTLESLAAKYDIDSQAIIDANGLNEPALVIGQRLIMPGAAGAPIATPAPVVVASKPRTTTSRPSSGGTTAYSGGKFAWPVVGGSNYISQYFHASHPALDIAADYGSPVVAAASGTVIFAGWKNNGGGWQVWISHGSGMYTTYNHMSALTTATGRAVSRGQQVGRIGQSGWATGPHCHFEVWIGPIWSGGYRVNPLKYY